MKTVVFFLEELSAKDLIGGLCSRLLPADVAVQFQTFEGKQDLDARLKLRLRHWRAPNTVFVVVRDQDAADCKLIKNKLSDIVRSSGREALVRIACRELESWILGDLESLAKAYDRPTLAKQQTKKNYRNPDQLHRPSAIIRDLLPEYQKRDGAKRLGVLLNPKTNASASFRAFCSGLTTHVAKLQENQAAKL